MDSDILIVDDNPGMIQVMGRVLSAWGRVRFATSGAAALAQMAHRAPDILLLDAEMPDMSGYDVCARMQSDPDLAHVPVIFVTAHSDTASELRGLSAGAVDFVAKPISEPLLVARVRTQLRIKRLTDELRKVASIDALTEVCNRGSLDSALAREWSRAVRHGEPISLLMIDVDHFKRYNDLHGHPAGDACLRQVAAALQACVRRPSDLVGRYGGEEFVLLLPQTPVEGAVVMGERVLAAVDQLAIPHGDSPTATQVTVSIGVGSHDASAEPTGGVAALLARADQALYAAKRAGRARLHRQGLDEAPVDGAARRTVA